MRWAWAWAALLWSANAAAKSPYRTPGEIIVEAPTLAVVRVVAVGAEGVSIERVETLAGAPPAKAQVDATVFAEAPPRAGDLLVAPLQRVGERWAFAVSTRAPIRIDPGAERAAIAFVRAWRTAPTSDAEALVRATQHPSALARALALSALDRLPEGSASPAVQAQIIERLRVPGVEAEDRVRLAGVLARLGGEAGITLLAEAWSTLATDRVRLAVAGIFARSDSLVATHALTRCAAQETGALGARCRRIGVTRAPAARR